MQIFNKITATTVSEQRNGESHTTIVILELRYTNSYFKSTPNTITFQLKLKCHSVLHSKHAMPYNFKAYYNIKRLQYTKLIYFC